MPFLVDGYNLMHAAGYLTSKPTQRLEPARRRFLDWLAGIGRAKKADLRVVFDGPGSSAETDHQGVRVRFGRTADDEIEKLLLRPLAGLVVVSNDSRLHEAARRAGVAAWNSDRFLDWVIGDARIELPAPAPLPEKPTASTEDDVELLAAFQQPRGRR